MSNNKVIAILNDLIEACRQRQESYRSAAEEISNSEFRRLFNIFSQQRAQFETELQAEVHRLGGPPAAREDHWSSRHGERSGLESGDRPADEPAIILDCQRREEETLHHYQEALKADLPLDVQYVVKRQYMDIKDAYDRIRILQRAA